MFLFDTLHGCSDWRMSRSATVQMFERSTKWGVHYGSPYTSGLLCRCVCNRGLDWTAGKVITNTLLPCTHQMKTFKIQTVRFRISFSLLCARPPFDALQLFSWVCTREGDKQGHLNLSEPPVLSHCARKLCEHSCDMHRHKKLLP